VNCPHCQRHIEHPNTAASRKLRQDRKAKKQCWQCGVKLSAADLERERPHIRCSVCRESENIRQALKPPPSRPN
jgi:hypothetical protein